MRTLHFGGHGVRVRDICSVRVFNNGYGYAEKPWSVQIMIPVTGRIDELFDSEEAAKERSSEVIGLMAVE